MRCMKLTLMSFKIVLLFFGIELFLINAKQNFTSNTKGNQRADRMLIVFFNFLGYLCTLYLCINVVCMYLRLFLQFEYCVLYFFHFM